MNSNWTCLVLNMTSEMSQMECELLGNFLLMWPRRIMSACRARALKFLLKVAPLMIPVCLFSLECFSHALVLGVVTPRQAPVQCCREVSQSCVQSSCFGTAAHTLTMLTLHLDTCALRMAQVRSKRSYTFMVAEPFLFRTRSLRCHVCGASDP